MSRQSIEIFVLSSVLLVGAFVQSASAQDAQEDPETPPAPPAALDELPGIEEKGESHEEAQAHEPEDLLEERREQALEDRLQERSLAENFAAAVGDMEVAANMLAEQKDPGLELQRLQEEIIKRLDSVIKEAEQQQQQSSSSSSSQQQQQQQEQQQQQQVPNRPEQNQQDGEQSEQQQESQGQEGEQQPPARQEADLQAIFEESNVEWGTLPDRLREMIRQGLRESISRTYRRMTEEYYRKIAEEASE